jgi:LemA protein
MRSSAVAVRQALATSRAAVMLLALGALAGCGTYNTIVQQREQIDAQWAQVENQLQRRNDLIPNLVETTKGYAQHEQAIFTAVAEARSKLIGAKTREEKIEAANEVSSALSRLLAISENYPNLKADAQFARLSDELAGTENRISTERRRYNEDVKSYNANIKIFPNMLFAGCMGFQPEKYFEAPESAKAVPKVQF